MGIFSLNTPLPQPPQIKTTADILRPSTTLHQFKQNFRKKMINSLVEKIANAENITPR